jgi:uncharacterized Rossmann fold enzyme
MDYAEWQPAYGAVCRAFGYEQAADERARDVLASLTGPFDLDRLDFRDATVAIVAPGPQLTDELDQVRSADRVIAVSAAADALLEAGVDVDLMVTDLDSPPAAPRRLAAAGVPVAVHAHGDNVGALREQVPALVGEQVLPTTQAAPRLPVVNFGGFTDGDRAAFLADHVGAASLTFPGWDLADESVSESKRRKLDWAARLLAWLERRRGERFPVLDGRRESLSLPWLDG